MDSRPFALALVCVGLVLASCGESDKGDQASGSDQNCVILASGEKLCGADAKAYCDGFQPSADDLRSVEACRAVGSVSGEVKQRDAEFAKDEKIADAVKAVTPIAEEYLGGKHGTVMGELSGEDITVETELGIEEFDKLVGRGVMPEMCVAFRRKTDLSITVIDAEEVKFFHCPPA